MDFLSDDHLLYENSLMKTKITYHENTTRLQRNRDLRRHGF